MVELWVEIFRRAMAEMLAARGTTMIGILVPVIVLVLRTVIKAVAERKVEVKRKEVIYSTIAVVIVWIVMVSIYMKSVEADIKLTAERTLPPAPISYHIQPPHWAYEYIPASLEVLLIPHQVPMLNLTGSGPYDLADKKEYSLILRSPVNDIRAADVEITFPYPVEAYRVIQTSGIKNFTFDASLPLMNFVGPNIRIEGCIGRWTYRIKAEGIGRHGTAVVFLILNGQAIAHPNPNIPPTNDDGYIAGNFTHSYMGRNMRSGYYSVLKQGPGMVIDVSRAEDTIPAQFKKHSGFTVLGSECIPGSALISTN